MADRPMTPPAGRDTVFSGWLDVFRGLAAFAVLFGHARALFIRSADGGPCPLAARGLYLLSGFGHQAVMVFFVLSGYLVGGTVVRAVRGGRWSWGRYLLQRGTRLYVVLIPALLLTLLWDRAEGLRSAGLSPNDDTAAANIRSETIREHTGAGVFAGNAAFVQTILVPPLGSNTPLWSLANEFWYYLAFPLIWVGAAGPGLPLWSRAAHLGAAGLALWFAGGPIAAYFAVWLLGVAVAVAPDAGLLRRAGARRAAAAPAAAGVLIALLATRSGKVGPEVGDAALGVGFAALLYVMRHDRSPAAYPGVRRAAGWLADFSYTLYLVHLPPLIFLRACLTYEAAWPPDAAHWGWLGLIVAGVTGYAYLVSLLTERRTDAVRRWFERRVWPGAAPRAGAGPRAPAAGDRAVSAGERPPLAAPPAADAHPPTPRG
ncbi:MAG: hypothetical protein C0501_27695, partial [Isosphaera sp.]|nr:hypothetical protein [Isosphaera sp.]